MARAARPPVRVRPLPRWDPCLLPGAGRLLIAATCRSAARHSRASALEADTPIQLCDWEVYLKETAQKILQEQSPSRLLEVRGRLYELLTHCIPPDVILKVRLCVCSCVCVEKGWGK